jgi:hypothetical protein
MYIYFQGFILIFVRFQQIESILKLNTYRSYLKIINIIGLIFGATGCLGFTIVGNFQVIIILKFFSILIIILIKVYKGSINPEVHNVGTILLSAGILTYLVIQTFLSNRISKHLYSNICLLIFRILLIFSSLACILLCNFKLCYTFNVITRFQLHVAIIVFPSLAACS